LVEMVLPQDMVSPPNGAKQRLAAGAHRAVVKGPSDFCIMPTSNAQALAWDSAVTAKYSRRSKTGD
jgi:hypothetical protein